VLFLHNFAPEPREVGFGVGVSDGRGDLLVDLLSSDHSRADGRHRHTVCLEGYGYRWYRVGGLDYLLNRSDT
jgi:maltose alpha-D-glucosyltransferase/alpha-amylase